MKLQRPLQPATRAQRRIQQVHKMRIPSTLHHQKKKPDFFGCIIRLIINWQIKKEQSNLFLRTLNVLRRTFCYRFLGFFKKIFFRADSSCFFVYLFDAFPVNLTEVYISPGKHHVENMNQLKINPCPKDENYVLAIRSGGPAADKAIISLYTEYHKTVLIAIADVIESYPGCKTEPEDMMHDSFLIMLHKIQVDCLNAVSLKAFWIGIAKKLISNHDKKNGRIILVEDRENMYGACDIDPETIYITTERHRQIEEYLSLFGERCKEILLLWMAQYSMDEIAEQLNLSGARMARKIKHSCFKKLKAIVTKRNKFSPEDII